MTAHSAIEFLLWMLIAAGIIAVIAIRLKIPYTVALVLGGLALGSIHLPILQTLYKGPRPDWLTPEIILICFLPALLFEGSLKINARLLRESLFHILLLATVGVVLATLITGFLVHWLIGLPVMFALIFGAIISATDPIAVLAIFKELAIHRRLTLLLEGESLFNDGTAVVLFEILLAALATSHFSIAWSAGRFAWSVVGGAGVGAVMGYVGSKLTKRIDEPQIEITLTTVLAYGSYLIALHLGLSGVIATVVAGVVFGNLGQKQGMNERTRHALLAFWEYAAFVFNSLVFLLIGMEVRVSEIFQDWRSILLTIGAVLLGRAIAVYGLTPLGNLMPRKYVPEVSLRWQHVMVWGGLHGALSLALALSLASELSYRDEILTLTFGVVAFSIIVQGLTIKPLLRLVGVAAVHKTEPPQLADI